MKKSILDFSLIGVVVALGAALSGCAGITAAGITAAEQSFISDVQAASSAVCSFLPTASSIAALFTDASAVAATAEAVATDICTSLTAPTVSMKLARRKMGVSSSMPVIVLNGHSYVIQGSHV
jgi:hypothetical protein